MTHARAKLPGAGAGHAGTAYWMLTVSRLEK